MRVEGLETLDYLDNLQDRARFTEQGDAIVFESEVRRQSISFTLYHLSFSLLLKKAYAILQLDRIYLGTPSKIAIIDHEKKRTFVVRKGGLPDAGLVNAHLYFACYCNRLLSLKQFKNEVHEVSYIFRYSCLEPLG